MIGLVIPNNLWFCPFVKIYTDFLDKKGIEYQIISWNRNGNEEDVIQYNDKIEKPNKLKLFYHYLKFSFFVKRTIKENNYDKLIIFTSQVGVFISSFLKKYYKNKYIFDYRDLSIEQQKIFGQPFISIVKNSYSNFISSPGFKKCLPKNIEYKISHNFNVENVRKALATETEICKSGVIRVLTIGGIRDFRSNSEVIAALSNKENIEMDFVGRGAAAPLLEEYARSLNTKNIHFSGYYQKEDEEKFVLNSTFLNIFYPKIISHETALSNRFYNSLIYKRPMIVTKGGIQGEYVEKYNLGVAVDDCTDLSSKLRNFLDESGSEYVQNCNKLLREFLKDYQIFEETLNHFVEL